MTTQEYIDYAMGIRNTLKTVCVDALPNSTKVFNRYILSGKNNTGFNAQLTNAAGKIQCLVILTNALPIASLSGTAGGNSLHSQLKFKLELYHQYETAGTDSSNSEDNFIKDCLALQFALGKHRSFGGYAVIENKIEFKLGISVGTFPTHKAIAEVVIDLRNVRY